jgi:hypothetical protein
MKPALAAVREQRKLPRAVGRRCTFDIRWRQLGGNNATKSPSRVPASNSLFEHGIAINVDIEEKLSDEAGGAEEQRIVIHSKFQSAQCRLRSDSSAGGCLHPGEMRALAACIHSVNSEH